MITRHKPRCTLGKLTVNSHHILISTSNPYIFYSLLHHQDKKDWAKLCILLALVGKAKPKHAMQVAQALNRRNRVGCISWISSLQHVDQSAGHCLLHCPAAIGFKYEVMLSTELQLTHGQEVMCPRLSNHDCHHMKVVQGLP